MTSNNARHLECCCCGSFAGYCEQHWNRDTGYGLCEGCIDYCARGETPESFERTYGTPGVHYARAPKWEHKEPEPSVFSVGDKVTFTNDYGARFEGKTISRAEMINGEMRYYYEPSDSPWYPVPARNLSKAEA